MAKHIADKQQETGSGRVRNYTRHDREAGLHPAIGVLHSRPKATPVKDGRRVSEYVRIERGHRV